MTTPSLRADRAHAPAPTPFVSDATPLVRSLVAAAESADLMNAVLAGRKATTVRSYAADYADFARFVGAGSPSEALDALISLAPGTANAAALSYKAHLMDRKLSAATIARRLAALRSACQVARTLGRIDWELQVESPRSEPYRDTAGPGDRGWRAVLDRARAEAADGSPIGVRNLALVRFLHDLGLRRGELVAIDLGGFDREAGTVSIVGKGRTEATRLTLPDPARDALLRWVEVRGPAPGPLFHRLDRAADAAAPGRLTADGVHKIIGELGKRAGLTRPLRPHGIRHQAITQVLDRNGGDLRAAARFSRHRDLRMLEKYDDNRTDLAGQMARLIADE